eukprot:CAMPEP_0115296454 /NCGR_PEP_ID=MMETSP0270-20121206/67239_1 /TAXON_ID=71861 /ORGANISM="Scrippsiella trochoidea, Strain CCMP3099" /LENGTH=175 /DNA_ID=CAMNT_0002714077 /DNA_START=1 /DNA_END=529 /DNA_ORIENTATION=-
MLSFSGFVGCAHGVLHRGQVHLRGDEEIGPWIRGVRALRMQEVVVESGTREHVTAALRVAPVTLCGLPGLGEHRPSSELVIVDDNVVQEGMPLAADVRKNRTALGARHATFTIHSAHLLKRLAPSQVLIELRQHYLQLIFANLTALEAGELVGLLAGEGAPGADAGDDPQTAVEP